MPSLSHILKGALPPRLPKKIKLSDSFYDSVFSDDTSIVDRIPVIPNLVDNSFTVNPFRSSTVINHAENNQSIKEGFATSSFIQHAGYFPEFLPGSVTDISSISSDSEHSAAGCTHRPHFNMKSNVQKLAQSPVPLDADAGPPPIVGGVIVSAASLVKHGGGHGEGALQPIQRCSYLPQEQKIDIKPPNKQKVPTAPKQRKKGSKF